MSSPESLNVQTLFIEPGSPGENGYFGLFNGKLRHELLDREIFYTLTDAQSVIELGTTTRTAICRVTRAGPVVNLRRA